MNILFVASEVAPFAKTGGLADVTGSLPKELKRLGHDVRIILPLYKGINSSDCRIAELSPLVVNLGHEDETGMVHQAEIHGMPVYFIEHDKFFGRDYLYGTPSGDYPDNARRFAFFCRAVLEFLKLTTFQPDILHCHDWQTALLPVLIHFDRGTAARFQNTAVLFTIHNLAYHGLFPRTALADLGLDESYFTIDRLEYYGSINLLKGAILAADQLNTVSETYCKEIQTPELGCGLDGVLRVRRNDLSGIVNGIDYAEWNPESDDLLCSSFSADNFAGKAANKADLQRLLNLEVSPEIPLLGVVSRLAAQKGFDLIAKVLPRITAEKIQLVVLGSGEEKYVRLLTKSSEAASRNVSVNFRFDDLLAHKIYAGCDLFLMPSNYEPCGLGQLIALRYGTVPVVRRTGGLADTVIDPQDSPVPTGFSFSTYSASALWQAIGRALVAWQEKEGWEQIMRRGMEQDFSWHSSALHYEELYRLALTKKGIGND